MDQTKKERLLRVDQVAETLNCSVRHVYDLIVDGELCALKIGRKNGLRIPESSLDSFVRRRIEAFESENFYSE